MDEVKLMKLYSEASEAKLLAMLNRSERLNAQSRKLEREADDIQGNIKNAVNAKFGKYEDKETMDVPKFQILEMNKQWSILAASMVKVKRSVLLPGFHSDYNLVVNNTYGVKVHKKYSSWSPFGIYNLNNDYTVKRFEFKEKGILNLGYGDYLSFGNLQNIPQLDQTKVKQLHAITKDIVEMLDSWRFFYISRDTKMLELFNFMKDFHSMYHDEERKKYKDNLVNLPRILRWKEKLIKDTVVQRERWDKVLESWKEENKNYLVLVELSKRELKV